MTSAYLPNSNVRSVIYSFYTEFNISERDTHLKLSLPSAFPPSSKFCCFSDLPILRQYHLQLTIQARQFPRLLLPPHLIHSLFPVDLASYAFLKSTYIFRFPLCWPTIIPFPFLTWPVTLPPFVSPLSSPFTTLFQCFSLFFY